MASTIEEYRKKFGTQTTKTVSPIKAYQATLKQTTETTPSPIELYRQKQGLAPKINSKDLKTAQGLYGIAAQSGLKNQADSIVAKNTGETNEYLSGGLITKFFDVLNTLDYGVVGVLKGKTFQEGVKGRESFADKDSLGGNGILGTVVGTILDIAVDPLTWIAPMTILKKVPGLTKVAKVAKEATFGKMVERTIEGTGKVVQELDGGTTAGKYLADKFSYMFGRDPAYKDYWQKMEKNIGVSATKIKQMTNGLLDLPEDKFNKLLQLGDDFRFERKSMEELQKFLTPEEMLKVKQSSDFVDELGQQMVDLGLLNKATYEANKGKYIKSLYTKYAEKDTTFASRVAKITGGKARKDLTPEQIKELGQIDNPAYIFAKTTMDMIKDIENTKMFNGISESFGTDVAQKGFSKITQGNMGAISGKFVPDIIHKDLTELIRPASDFEKVLRKATSEYKFFKVVLNPASNIRNIISNKFLNNFDEAGMPLYRLDKDYQGLKSFLTKDKWYKEVESLGGAVDTFRSAEIGNLLDTSGVGKLGQGYSKFKEFMGNIYQGEEMQAKMSMYIYQRTTKKLAPEEAWKIAERATFNYAQVTPFIMKLRSNLFGAPFITFTAKATPVIAKTVLKSPTKISNIGKIKNSIEKLANIQETEAERASEPSWVKNGFYIKLPFKDDQGRSAYFDMTYILPFGDLANLGDESSLSIFSKSPALGFIRDIGSNKDYFGNKIYKETDSTQQKAADILRHFTKSVLPPPIADQVPGGYNPKTGERLDKFGRIVGSLEATPENQKRSLTEELARMAGFKVQPIVPSVQESVNEWRTKKDLELLLTENQKLRAYEGVLAPKD